MKSMPERLEVYYGHDRFRRMRNFEKEIGEGVKLYVKAVLDRWRRCILKEIGPF